MAIDPFTGALIVGGLSAAMGSFGASAAQAQRKQDYVNQAAYQDANNEFSMWQAGFNAQVQDTNNQNKYWQQTVNHNQQMAFAHSQRNVELMNAINQAGVVRDTRVQAGVSYTRDAEAIQAAMGEQEMQAAVAQQQYTYRALQARASVQASGMEGNSVDRIVNDYARQLGDAMTLEAINADIRDRQYTRAQAGKVSEYMSRWNSQTFYNEQEVFNPLPPFAPLPTLIQPPPPSMKGGAPGNAAYAADVAGAVVGGIGAGFNTYTGLAGLKTPSGTGAGTGTGVKKS